MTSDRADSGWKRWRYCLGIPALGNEWPHVSQARCFRNSSLVCTDGVIADSKTKSRTSLQNPYRTKMHALSDRHRQHRNGCPLIHHTQTHSQTHRHTQTSTHSVLYLTDSLPSVGTLTLAISKRTVQRLRLSPNPCKVKAMQSKVKESCVKRDNRHPTDT